MNRRRPSRRKNTNSSPPKAAHKPPAGAKRARARKRGGIASGTRSRFRADKLRRAGGGEIQVEPLSPPNRNIPGTDIPDQSRSEGANAPNDLQDADRDMPNAFDSSPNRNMDLAAAPHVDPQNYPGILNAPIKGSHKPSTRAPYPR